MGMFLWRHFFLPFSLQVNMEIARSTGKSEVEPFCCFELNFVGGSSSTLWTWGKCNFPGRVSLSHSSSRLLWDKVQGASDSHKINSERQWSKPLWIVVITPTR